MGWLKRVFTRKSPEGREHLLGRFFSPTRSIEGRFAGTGRFDGRIDPDSESIVSFTVVTPQPFVQILVSLNAMTLLPRMDRTIVKRTTLDQQGVDAGVPNATPAERMMMVWPLTLTAWAFKEPNVVQPRLQRHVVCVIRDRH